MHYNDPTDITDHDSTERSEEDALSTVNLFRTKSLLLATFPWFTVLPMVPSKLVENIGETRDAFVRHSFNSFISLSYVYIYIWSLAFGKFPRQLRLLSPIPKYSQLSIKSHITRRKRRSYV
jgi:hypothetical protein